MFFASWPSPYTRLEMAFRTETPNTDRSGILINIYDAFRNFPPVFTPTTTEIFRKQHRKAKTVESTKEESRLKVKSRRAREASIHFDFHSDAFRTSRSSFIHFAVHLHLLPFPIRVLPAEGMAGIKQTAYNWIIHFITNCFCRLAHFAHFFLEGEKIFTNASCFFVYALCIFQFLNFNAVTSRNAQIVH